MVRLEQSGVRNRLLRALSPEDFGLLEPHLVLVPGPVRAVLIEAHAAIAYLYFPEVGFTSVTIGTSAGTVEVGMIGREGLVGASPALLGVERTPYQSYVQMPGENLRISVRHIGEAVDRSATLRGLLLRYVQVVVVQTAQTAFVNAIFDIEVRLARWLLMCHDRADGDGMNITHEFLSMMLGVRRAGVTVAIQILEGGGLIKATRGHIRMVDREGLKSVAEESYGLAEAEYTSLIEPHRSGR